MVLASPIIDHLKRTAGRYRDASGNFEIELRTIGSNLLLLAGDEGEDTQLYGVIGINGDTLELHAAIGLPNIITLSWPHAYDKLSQPVQIEFSEQIMALAIGLAFNADEVRYTVSMAARQLVDVSAHRI